MSLKPGLLTAQNSDVGRKDAFHIPAIVVTSDQDIHPGDHLFFVTSNAVKSCVKNLGKVQAIADIFVTKPLIKAGTPFWAFIMPGLVAEFTHNFNALGIPEPERVVDPRIAELEEKIRELESEKDGDERNRYTVDPDDECGSCNW